MGKDVVQEATNENRLTAENRKFLSKAERSHMSIRDRLRYLEDLDHVPEDGDPEDWRLAEKTSWWGKPIDPKAFWRDRVVWPDEAAVLAANRRGRRYPPIPYEDINLPLYPDDDGIDWNSDTVEGPNWHFARSSKERAFWSRFGKTAPKPPAMLERRQSELAVSILETREREDAGGLPLGIAPGAAARAAEVEKRRALRAGYPHEAFADSAMFWAYVLARRRDYQEMLSSNVPRHLPLLTNFVNRLAVDPKYVTEPLTEEQIKAANAWKLAYLQRLRREKVDESYIRAYLQAWNLSEAEVFGGANRP
jgi:hypothetical protein